MLKDGWREELAKVPVVPYMDAHFQQPEHLLELALRMGRAGMLVLVPEARATVSLFTVVKSAARLQGGVQVGLRLIFDERRNNHAWRDPPWIGLGGVSSLASLDVSEEMAAGDLELRFATGDVPN